MTNAKIIESARQELIANGIITADEAIHTFAAWKAAGLSVKKGEKAIAKFSIWKYKTKKATAKDKDRVTGETVEEEVEVGQMFMTTASFFSSRQVEKRTEAPAA